MVFYTKSAQFASNTGTGTQDLTVSGSDTPVAVLIEISSATTSGTAIAGMRFGAGFSDGTNSRAFSVFSENGVVGANSGGRNSATNLVEMTSAGSTVIDGRAAFSTWLNSGGSVGVRINWTSAPSAAYLLNVTFFFGATEALVSTLTTSATENATVSISGMSNQPNLALGFFGSTGAGFNTINRSLGWAADNEGTIEQGCKIFSEIDASGPPASAGDILNDRIGGALVSVSASAASNGSEVELTSWNSDGATFTTRNAAASLTGAVLLLVIPSDQKRSVKTVVNDASGTSITDNAGTHTVEFGFEPIHLSVIGTGHQTINSPQTGAVGPWISHGHAQSSSSRVVQTCQIEDNAATTDTRGYSDTAFVAKLLNNTGATSFDMDLDSFSGVGAVVDIGSAAAAAFYNIYVAVGQPEADRVLTENVVIADQAILEPTLTTTEQVLIADQAILEPTLTTTEAVNIADAFVLYPSNVGVVTNTLVASEDVLIADTAVLDLQDFQLELVATEAVLISDQAILDPTMTFIEDVFITERVRLFGSIVVSVSESVQVADAFEAYTGTVFTTSEDVFISDGFSFGDGLVVMKSGGGARQIAFGGAEFGLTEQGGMARGVTVYG